MVLHRHSGLYICFCRSDNESFIITPGKKWVITVISSRTVSYSHLSPVYVAMGFFEFRGCVLVMNNLVSVFEWADFKQEFPLQSSQKSSKKFCQMHLSSVSTPAVAPSSLMKKTQEEAPFNPQGLALMPALASVKGKASQHVESIGSREAACWLPTQRPTEKGKQIFSANSNKDETFAREAFTSVLHYYITGHFSHLTQ